MKVFGSLPLYLGVRPFTLSLGFGKRKLRELEQYYDNAKEFITKTTVDYDRYSGNSIIKNETIIVMIINLGHVNEIKLTASGVQMVLLGPSRHFSSLLPT